MVDRPVSCAPRRSLTRPGAAPESRHDRSSRPPRAHHDRCAACIDFYTRVLGLTLETFAGGRCAFRFNRQKINLHERGHEFEPKAHLPVPGALDLCFIADRPLDNVIAHLQSLRVADHRRAGGAHRRDAETALDLCARSRSQPDRDRGNNREPGACCAWKPVNAQGDNNMKRRNLLLTAVASVLAAVRGHGGRAGLSEQIDHAGGPVRGRRTDRCRGAHRRDLDEQVARPDDHRREQTRRGRHRCGELHRQGGARRLHDLHPSQRDGDRNRAVSQAAV